MSEATHRDPAMAAMNAEANAFALELLVPTFFLRMDLERLGGADIEDISSIERLAKRYRVSTAVMAIRIGMEIL